MDAVPQEQARGGIHGAMDGWTTMSLMMLSAITSKAAVSVWCAGCTSGPRAAMYVVYIYARVPCEVVMVIAASAG